MNIITVAGITVVAALTVVFIKKYSPEQAMVISVAAGCVISVVILIYIKTAIDEVKTILESSKLDSDMFDVVIKALGIGIVTRFSTNICNDFGQTSLSAKVELAGKVLLVFISLPTVRYILDSVMELIK